MPIEAMPSSKGTNVEKLYILRGRDSPVGTYDAATPMTQNADDETVLQLFNWGLENLAPQQLLALAEKIMAHLETSLADNVNQQQPSAAGQWRGNASAKVPVKQPAIASDAAALSPSAARLHNELSALMSHIRVDTVGVRMPAPRSKTAPSLAMDEKTQAMSLELFGDLARIRVLG